MQLGVGLVKDDISLILNINAWQNREDRNSLSTCDSQLPRCK